MPEAVILGAARARTSTWVPKPETGWTLLRILGVVFIIAGGIDLALLWYPSRWGTPEFEFATITQFVAGLPVLTTGVVAVGISAVGRGQRGLQLAVATFALVAVAVLVFLAVVYATDVPLALRVSTLEIKTGIKKAITRSGIQFVAYGVGYLALAWTLIKASRK